MTRRASTATALPPTPARPRSGQFCYFDFPINDLAGSTLGIIGDGSLGQAVAAIGKSLGMRVLFSTTVRRRHVFVVDPGFGGLAPDYPVPLTQSAEGRDSPHWIARDGGYWMLRARSAGNVVDCWASTLEADNRVDFEVCNHYTATHPASPFVNRLMLRAVTQDGTVSVMNRTVTHVDAQGARETQLADRSALRMLLASSFGIDLPEVESIIVPAVGEWR